MRIGRSQEILIGRIPIRLLSPQGGSATIADLVPGKRHFRMNVFGLAGWSNSGKTTLIERLLPILVARGLRVSVVKHAHERFDIDRPGKDSFRYRDAGSHEVLISSPARWALMREHRNAVEPTLAELLGHLSECDLALIEGWKRETIPKLEVHRPALGKPLLSPEDPRIVAIASDVEITAALPTFRLDDADAIAEFIVTGAFDRVAVP